MVTRGDVRRRCTCIAAMVSAAADGSLRLTSAVTLHALPLCAPSVAFGSHAELIVCRFRLREQIARRPQKPRALPRGCAIGVLRREATQVPRAFSKQRSQADALRELPGILQRGARGCGISQ